MKIFLITSGHSTSTFDLGVYYANALGNLGVDIRQFRYDVEIKFALKGLQAFRETEEEYSGEAIYLASRSAIAGISIFQPDCVVVITATTLFYDTLYLLDSLRASLKCPFRLVIILTESPYLVEDELNAVMYADHVFTNERNFLSRLRRIQPMSYYLPHAYCDAVHFHRLDGPPDYRHEVFFCGSGFAERIKLLRDAKLDDVDIIGYFPDMEKYAPDLMPSYTEGSLKNAEVAEQYRKSKVCLNFHRTSGKRIVFEVRREGKYHYVEREPTIVKDCYSVNNRAIEVAACGGFQLCDDGRQELIDIFGDSVPTFSCAEELRAKANYYLAHEDLRRAMAREARQRVDGRTYDSNARFILEQLDK